jgi:hypothetical protein
MPFDIDEKPDPDSCSSIFPNTSVWIMPIRDQDESDEISRYRLFIQNNDILDVRSQLIPVRPKFTLPILGLSIVINN